MNTYRVYEQYQKQPQEHLTKGEALKLYQELKRKDPNALIELEELECGHWSVTAYKTKEEKDAFVKRKWSDMTSRFSTI